MSKFKKITFKLFSRKIEVKLSKKDDKERIKYLAKELHRELVQQGKFEFVKGTCKSFSVNEYDDSIIIYSYYDGEYMNKVVEIKKGGNK